MRHMIFLVFGLALLQTSFAQQFVLTNPVAHAFPIAPEVPAIYVERGDDWLARKSAELLQADIEAVTGKKPLIIDQLSTASKNIIVIGTLRGCALIRNWEKAKKIKTAALKNQWEAHLLQTLDHPASNIAQALVITGSDKRGTAYGVLELSRQLGVSPWYWWADVPAKQKKAAYIKPGTYYFASPSVQYRGIFINDEAPAFSGWTREKFKGVNHLAYEKVFELLLRLKANYLWPAMWGNAFNDDDTLNPVLADRWGIVMGTSHHEPMLRAQQEWKRYGKGPWDYTQNDSVLRAFWRKGMEAMGTHESLVTVGMRGDGDMPMTEGTAIELLEKIVKDQRQIIQDVTKKPAAQTPQIWALYKEVQAYYDKGMRVPDDITLLLCDDNWGNIRKLPKLHEPARKGGYGIYYHFDYVGDPRNYKWINTNNIARVWEQMQQAYAYGAKKVWIVNVGDIKPMELPISFFLDYAWDVKKWNQDNILNFFTEWAREQFGPAQAPAIADLLRKYSQYASRRKPELLDAHTYSLTAYNEWDRILEQWTKLMRQADSLKDKIPATQQDAYFQLVWFPITAFGNLHQLYYAVAKNAYYFQEKDPAANDWADKAQAFYRRDSLLTIQYNKELAGGKWSHMMDQTHIGYTYWQQPETNSMPAVQYLSADSAQPARMIVHQPTHAAVSILAAHYTKAADSGSLRWKIIPDIGREGDGVKCFPVTIGHSGPFRSTSPHLEYTAEISQAGRFEVSAYFSPTLNFRDQPGGLQFALSIDNEKPQILSLQPVNNSNGKWEQWVAQNTITVSTSMDIKNSGRHILKYWLVSPGPVLQKIVLTQTADDSYLGAPETH